MVANAFKSRSLKVWRLAIIGFVATALSWGPVASAPTIIEAQAEIASALFSAAATQVATEKAASAKITALRAQLLS